MRISLVNKYFYRKGGAEIYFFAFAEGLKALGHEVTFFSMQHPNSKPGYWSKYFVSEKGYIGKISAFKKMKEAATLVYSFEAKRKLEALLEEFQPDIIRTNNVYRQLTLSILDAPYLKKHRAPVVYAAHDYILLRPAYTMVDGSGKVCDGCLDCHFFHVVKKTCVKGSKARNGLAFLEAEFLKSHHSYDRTDKIIAPSEFMKHKLDEGGYAGRTVAIQNFLTTSQMDMAHKVANTNKFNTVEPYLLFFGRLSKEKGVLTLVRAFLRAAGLMNSGVAGSKLLPANWTSHIVDDGPEHQAIENLIKSADPKAKRRIRFLDYRTGEDLQREVGNARFSVLCSEWWENIPYSGLESLAAQTPIISANIGGIPELVVEGKTGFRLESGQLDDLVNHLLQTSALNGDEYAVIQQECGDYINRRAQQSLYIRSLGELYMRCLQIPTQQRDVEEEK